MFVFYAQFVSCQKSNHLFSETLQSSPNLTPSKNGPFSIRIERNDSPFHGESLHPGGMGVRRHALELERGKVVVLGATFMSGIDDLILVYCTVVG